MKINKIFFVFLLCVEIQSNNIFCSEEGIKEIQPTQTWGQWAGYVSSTAAAAKRRVSQAISAVPTPSEWFNEEASPSRRAASMALPMGLYGVMTGALALFNQEIAMALMQERSRLRPFTKYFGGFVIPALAISAAVATFVMGYGIQKTFAYYSNKNITRQVAVNQVKDLISLQLADNLTYPTRSTKLHALLKKNEFLVNTQDVDGIVDQACSELSQLFATIKPDETQKVKDSLVDAQMNKIREFFIQNGIRTLDNQIAVVSRDINNILTDLDDPVIKAKISLIRRLEQQKIVEQKTPGTFAQTSSAQFYQPMTEVESEGFEERKKAWEKGMKEAERKTTLWEKSKE